MKGPCWTVPMEFVRALACATGTALLLRYATRGARFAAHAQCELTPNGWVAHVAYEEPAYPGRTQHLPLKLAPPAQENALGAAA